MYLSVLLNPNAGGVAHGYGFKRAMERVCKDQGIRYDFLTSFEPDLIPSNAIIACCGGDGTVSLLIQKMCQLRVSRPFCVVPLGTGNDFARATGWYNVWKYWGVEGVITGIRASKCDTLDVWGLEGKGGYETRFCAYMGLGADGEILRVYERLATRLRCLTLSAGQKRLYHVVAALIFLCSKGLSMWTRHNMPIEVSSPDGLFRERVKLGIGECLVFSNIEYYLGGMKLLDTAFFNDGQIELTHIKGLLSLALKGRLRRKKGVNALLDRMGRFGSLLIDVPKGIFAEIDGEPLGHLAPGCYTIGLDASLPILIPPKYLLAKEHATGHEIFKKKETGKIFAPEPSFY